MKPLLIILKTLIIGYLWSIVFIDGIRVLLLINWHFDIILKEHWQLLSNKWNSGEPISKSEIAFFMVIVSSIPLWLAGWVGLCLIKWDKLLKRIIMSPVYLFRKLTLKKKAPIIVKKKSVTEEIQPVKKIAVVKKVPVKKPLPSATLMQSNIHNNLSAAAKAAASYAPASKKNPEVPTSHALFNFDDDDFDLDFDFDKSSKSSDMEDSIPSALVVDEPKAPETKVEKAPVKVKTVEKSKPHKDSPQKNKAPTASNTATKESHTPVLDVIKQKGYDIISPVVIKNTTIDYIAVAKNQLIICLVDKETGDWLADEEKFKEEEPLWFSESSHRISPVRKVDLARDILKTKLSVADMNFNIDAYVVIQSGNIINAEDMFEIWDDMNIKVTRINRGTPTEIHKFSEELDNCEEKTDKNTLEKLKKLIHNLA